MKYINICSGQAKQSVQRKRLRERERDFKGFLSRGCFGMVHTSYVMCNVRYCCHLYSHTSKHTCTHACIHTHAQAKREVKRAKKEAKRDMHTHTCIHTPAQAKREVKRAKKEAKRAVKGTKRDREDGEQGVPGFCVVSCMCEGVLQYLVPEWLFFLDKCVKWYPLPAYCFFLCSEFGFDVWCRWRKH